jgi:hypothetical protein
MWEADHHELDIRVLEQLSVVGDNLTVCSLRGQALPLFVYLGHGNQPGFRDCLHGTDMTVPDAPKAKNAYAKPIHDLDYLNLRRLSAAEPTG